MPWQLESHADRVREARKLVDRRAYDANERMQPGSKEHARYRSSRRWQRIRRAFLSHYPVCNDPYGTHGEPLAAATQVDHIVPLARGGARADWENLQALCVTCHARKSQGERLDGHT